MPELTPRRLLAAAVVAWCVAVALGLRFGARLTGDEAAYALLARGGGADWLYRSRGVVALAQLGIALGGGGDVALRLVPTLASLPLVLAVAAVGRRAFGPWIGAAAAAVIAGAHPFVLRGFELLGDLPAAACLLGAIAIVVRELADEPPTYHLVGAAPLCAAALYLRYGSAPVIALIGGAACVTWWRAIRARPGPVVATAAVLAPLVAPFAIASTRATGSPLGILALAGDVSGRTWLGRGLAVYLLGNPFRQYGALVPIALVAAVASAWRPSPRRRVAAFLAAIAVGQIVALGLVAHPNPRFVFVAIALLVVLGVDALARAVPSPRARRAGLIAAVTAWLGAAIAVVPVEHHLARGLAELTASAAAIRADAAGRPCTVVARAVPQLMWYSGCAGWKLVGDAPPPVDAARRWYAASTPRRPIDPDALGAIATPLGPAWSLEPRRDTAP